MKQHLRIKAFYGNSDNAVRTQIWIAVAVYVLVAILRKRLGCRHSMADVLQILSVNAFEKISINTLFLQIEDTISEHPCPKQLRLFDL